MQHWDLKGIVLRTSSLYFEYRHTHLDYFNRLMEAISRLQKGRTVKLSK